MKRKLSISVIICTHNPRDDYLLRTLDGLAKQTLASEKWELIIIDNASDSLVESKVNLHWHPNHHFFVEHKLGLTSARILGISKARADLIVFIDDDNVLSEDYLQEALDIAECHPFLGAYGGGLIPEYEIEPAPEIRPWVGMLAIRPVTNKVWTNQPNPPNLGGLVPYGAGLVVRKSVAYRYLEAQKLAKGGLHLGRRGERGMGGYEDVHLALVSTDLQMGYGLFPALTLTHLISAKRVTPGYMLSLKTGEAASRIIFDYLRTGRFSPPPSALRLLARLAVTFKRQGWFGVRMLIADYRGTIAGQNQLRTLSGE